MAKAVRSQKRGAAKQAQANKAAKRKQARRSRGAADSAPVGPVGPWVAPDWLLPWPDSAPTVGAALAAEALHHAASNGGDPLAVNRPAARRALMARRHG